MMAEFENPNDLALNLVTFLAPTLFIIFQDRKPSRRLFAAGIAAAMLAAIVCTKSRSGFLGLIAMGAVVLYYVAKVKPAIVVAGTTNLVFGRFNARALPDLIFGQVV